MIQIIENVKIIGTGSYVPVDVYANSYLANMVATSDQWIQENLGIKERHIASVNELTSNLAERAAILAIENAGLTANDIDLIIVATATPDRLAPATACLVQDRIEAYQAVCFDLNAVCSGFLFALSTAAQLVSNGTYQNALIIGADTFSKITDWSCRDCVYFGDGAGAVVISRQSTVGSLQSAVEGQGFDRNGFMMFQLYSDGRGKSHFTVLPKRGTFTMNGKMVFQTATTVLPAAIKKILKDTGFTIADIDYLIPHQAGIRTLQRTAEVIGLPFEKVLTNMDRYGNTAGASIPLLLDEAMRSGKLENKLVLFAAIGSGWTWGVGLVKF